MHVAYEIQASATFSQICDLHILQINEMTFQVTQGDGGGDIHCVQEADAPSRTAVRVDGQSRMALFVKLYATKQVYLIILPFSRHC